ncbi:calcium homeostasis modulator protein 4 [Rhinatrema bivittatum]|uniref:calcium homeostasis modulator protein 4 n=1 Tax=Rhinatrema bivittatum TaxID=194408 RepID=UPI001128517D|nr:calcium homeostasis modulator protein 4 [Rhinatrema bivittatum]
MSFSSVRSFLKSKESILFNTTVALLTIGGQQLFAVFAFSCPCRVRSNVYYGLAFIGVPALILLIAGYVFNEQTWRLITGNSQSAFLQEGSRRSHLIKYKLLCLVLCTITGRALVAPVTWLAVTLLNGSYYVCALSEFASVEGYEVFGNLSTAQRREMLAGFPCPQLVPLNVTRVKDEVILHLRYQSQVSGWILIAIVTIIVFLSLCLTRFLSPLTFLHLQYWKSYVNNENELFQQAVDRHSKIFAMQNIKKFFGFLPDSKNIKEIRIPSRLDWRLVSGLNLLRIVNEDHCHYSLLHAWAEEDPSDGKYIHIDEESNSITQAPE